MTYKQGEDLIFLSGPRSITRTRIWIIRLVLFFAWLSPTASSGEISIAYAVGRLFGFILVYWVALRIFSTKTETIQQDESMNPDTLIIDTLREEDVATRRQLVGAALPNSEYDDRDECWNELVKPYLEDHADVRRLDNSGRRWKLDLE
jgi:hypothetical protein